MCHPAPERGEVARAARTSQWATPTVMRCRRWAMTGPVCHTKTVPVFGVLGTVGAQLG